MSPMRFLRSLEGGMVRARFKQECSLVRGSVCAGGCLGGCSSIYSSSPDCIISYYLKVKMDSPTIICDPGTGYMKMGFAGDNFPKASFASLVGRPMLRYEENPG